MRLEKCRHNRQFKKGIKSNPSNYKSKSITCAVRKIAESIIRDIIVAYMNYYDP